MAMEVASLFTHCPPSPVYRNDVQGKLGQVRFEVQTTWFGCRVAGKVLFRKKDYEDAMKEADDVMNKIAPLHALVRKYREDYEDVLSVTSTWAPGRGSRAESVTG